MIDGSCHCGAVRFSYPREPEWLTDCNCTVCRRYSTLWAYAPVGEITMQMAVDATIAYVHGDKTLAMHSCKTCGCTQLMALRTALDRQADKGVAKLSLRKAQNRD